ncbi:MAG: maltose alpha-D-glucosyltransferase [Nitriliruptor sp.]|nr:MAG: maltose alpha-D-glucosyltransferase [Nitriliruptor sp.]
MSADPPRTLDDPQWYKDAVIYELHVRAFFDANDDGIGDFAGLTAKLDYLQDLGVTALWLLPFYPSPGRDDGYDIADYAAINRDYGTMRQFKRFVEEAHARGLKVITELVINHTSDQHAWFQRAVKAPPGSREREFYMWSDTPEKWEDVRIIFEDFEASNWTWHGEAQQYYWHRFFHHQPDLNFDSPEVQQAVKDVLDFWAETGVDGMRLDAIPYLFVRDGTNGENLPETHAFLKELRSHLDRHPDRMFLAEANQWPEDAAAYFGDGDECQMNFHFPLMPRLFMAVAQEDRFPIVDILQQTPQIPEESQWGIFLRNHDELTLEMVTDEERDYMYRAYAREHDMRVNLGIRRRLAPLLGNDRRLIELMNALLFSLPGTPIMYYGDEIGMGDNVYLGDRNGVRTPMQWSSDRNAGFSRANPQKLYLPTIIDPEYHVESVNVEAQQNNPRSLLWWMKRMIALRKRHRVFGRGEITMLSPDNAKVLAFVRSWTDPETRVEEQVLVITNLSRYAQACELDLADHAGRFPVELLGRTTFPRISDQPYLLTLGPYQYLWFSLERDPASVTLSKLPEFAGDAVVHKEEEVALPEVTVSGEWTALLRGPGRGRLETILPDVLQRQRWFGGKARTVRGTSVVHAIPVGRKDKPVLHVLIVEVEYVDGEPESYVVPVTFAEGEEAGRLLAVQPNAVLATVKGQGSKASSGVLVDALTDEDAQRALHQAMAKRRRHEGQTAALVGSRTAAFERAVDGGDLEPNLLKGEQSNTSVLFGDAVLMKVLRRLEDGLSPDVEVGAHLDHLEHVPAVVGALDVEAAGSATPRTLAMFQRFVPNEGDAWSLTLDELGRFAERVVSDPDGTVPGRSKRADDPLGLAMARGGLPESAHIAIGPYLASARLLGVRTAELHVALSDDRGDAAFTPEPMTRLSQRSLYQSIRNSVRLGLRAAGREARNLVDPQLAAEVRRIVAAESELLERLQALTDEPITATRIRTHGDYHLGQVLFTGRDFVIIDFEGEPARPLGERRLKRSPLRDVAGMLRSLQYATASTLRDEVDRGLVTPDHPNHDLLTVWLDRWLTWVSAAFLDGYLDVAAEQPFVPDDPDHLRLLLDAFLLEKAVYELGYEMNNRPAWVGIPLAGIAQVLDREATR